MMINKIFPTKLKKGDTLAVISPSSSFSILKSDTIETANQRFSQMGLKLEFGKHIKEIDQFNSSSIQSRLEDIHWAFNDSTINGIISVIGGYNCNQLLEYIDWKIIQNNPKIFCGYSDITALSNAIFTKAGLITYSGPHYSSFGQKINCEYTIDSFKKCLFSSEPFEIIPSNNWSDDAWYIDQENVSLVKNKGPYVLNAGECLGTIIGG